MGRCTTQPRGRGRTTGGFVSSGSKARPLATVFDECYGRVLDAKTRRDALDEAIAELAGAPPYVDVVQRLVCLRGISTLTAFALTVELGDWNRFPPASLGPFLGLTPSENSNGERRRQGAITKTGNSHARRLLVGAAWHQRRPPRLSVRVTLAVALRQRSGRRRGPTLAWRRARRVEATGPPVPSRAHAGRAARPRCPLGCPPARQVQGRRRERRQFAAPFLVGPLGFEPRTNGL